MDQIPGHGMAASSGGPTTPGTATTEAPKPEVPPLPDFTNWNLPPSEAPPPRGQPVPSGGQPGIRRSDMHRQAVDPWAPGQWVPVPPMLALSAPQVAPPLHQP